MRLKNDLPRLNIRWVAWVGITMTLTASLPAQDGSTIKTPVNPGRSIGSDPSAHVGPPAASKTSIEKKKISGYTQQSIQRGLMRIIMALPNAKEPNEKEMLIEWARHGLKARYQMKLKDRQGRIDQLQQQLDHLQAEYDRRKAATNRIVQVQLDSLKLSAEGLLATSEVVGMGSGGYDDAYGGMGGYGGDMMGEDMGDYGMDMEMGMEDFGGMMMGMGGGEDMSGFDNMRQKPLDPKLDPFVPRR